jgi:hypothetical protein
MTNHLACQINWIGTYHKMAFRSMRVKDLVVSEYPFILISVMDDLSMLFTFLMCISYFAISFFSQEAMNRTRGQININHKASLVFLNLNLNQYLAQIFLCIQAGFIFYFSLISFIFPQALPNIGIGHTSVTISRISGLAHAILTQLVIFTQPG